MGHILLKPSKDEDFYIYWSTVVDMPMAWGTRADLQTDPDFWTELAAEDRWERTDASGTSERFGSSSWDQDNHIRYGNYGYLRRSELKKLTDMFESLPEDAPESHPAILALLRPFED